MASYNEGKDEIVRWICEHATYDSRILDVGACDGKWSDLIRQRRDDIILDACEIFKPNAVQIMDKYDRIFVGDIFDYRYDYCQYDYIIFGDVLEHMDVCKAQDVLYHRYPVRVSAGTDLREPVGNAHPGRPHAGDLRGTIPWPRADPAAAL